MKKKISMFMLLIIVVTSLSACLAGDRYEKYSYSFFESFDTLTTIVGYTKNKEEFQDYAKIMEDRFWQLHSYYDKYKSYEGINNIKTINDNAGIKAVKVEKEIMDLILFSKEWYYKTEGKTNIAMGSVINLWSEYRDEGENDPENAKLPPKGDLEKANEHTDIEKIIIDEENSTIYLEDKEMSLDVGAVAKGYATELVAKEIEAKGLTSAIISAGGNIRTIGKPMDNIREKWGVGIQNPDKDLLSTGSNILDTIFLNNGSVVSSGDYQRYYEVDGKAYHHIIDPLTLMPGNYYSTVTLVTADSGLADFLSTTIFLMDIDTSKKLVESLEGVEAIWIFQDGEIISTQGMKDIMLSHGAKGGKVK